ncbi:hypothetical protein [Microbacterium lushaniae]|uniref:Uncharacterized protein n=1 Tax=Microbacterium lushaniae TaxID=2614639 RepID=A0A5J6L249_9MICO|nr:hypothetical protein [Microbacterium lushaniae]QEW02578.1 hypothetical protein F6J85_05315 [Microbacterium lushaniae]
MSTPEEEHPASAEPTTPSGEEAPTGDDAPTGGDEGTENELHADNAVEEDMLRSFDPGAPSA